MSTGSLVKVVIFSAEPARHDLYEVQPTEWMVLAFFEGGPTLTVLE